ncbi:helix-turn-helix domain-containing protein [Spirillospora sp. NPDC047279]|uniref:TetR/AcrR family transcriptional regulator n=1 Tax=Spirillospora sp. NPDC047279 TaxID=3155478 RepID=UPI0033E458D7
MDDTPRRPMRADARRNYERLLAEAEALIAERGTGASLEEIAKRADVGIGTLYRHFPTREALLETLLRERFDALGARATGLLDAPDPLDALLEWLRAFTRGTRVYQGLAESMLAALRDEESELYASCHGMRDAGRALLVRAQRAGTVRADLTALDMFVLANAIAWAAEALPEDAGIGERFLTFLVEGIRLGDAGAGQGAR